MLICKPIIALSALMLFLPNAFLAAVYASSGTVTVSTFNVSVGDKAYPVEYTMDNGGSITNAEVDIPNLSLFLDIESPVDGHLELTFSRQAYDALSFTEHEEPLVFVDGNETIYPSEFSQSCEQTSFVIPVRAGTEKLDLIYPDILQEHTHGYPQIVGLTENIAIEDTDFSVRLMTDSTKCDISFIREENKIHVDIQGRDEADVEHGYFRITIPHDLLGGNYTVLVDGEPVDFQERKFFIKNNTDIGAASAVRDDFSPFRASHLTFSYPVDAKYIEVVGTSAFPEPGMSDLSPMRDLKEDPIILSYEISHQDDEARTIIGLLITDENGGELVKNVTFDLEMTKVGEETPLLVDEFYAENGTITFDITHEGPVQVSGVRNDFPYAWMPEPGTEAIPMHIPLEPNMSYLLKIDVLTTDYAHDFHTYPDESVYLYFDTGSPEVGEVRIVPEFPYHIVLVVSALIGTIIVMNRTGLVIRFHDVLTTRHKS